MMMMMSKHRYDQFIHTVIVLQNTFPFLQVSSEKIPCRCLNHDITAFSIHVKDRKKKKSLSVGT